VTAKLSPEEVHAKYSPTPDPLWTPEVEAEFFARLPAKSRRDLIGPASEKQMLLREFGKETLKAQRMSAGYISTLGAILGNNLERKTASEPFKASYSMPVYWSARKGHKARALLAGSSFTHRIRRTDTARQLRPILRNPTENTKESGLVIRYP